ncbi:hypothetical protein DYB30_001247 [Aphanomyces astaci]|uniref:Sodium/calcium exchanger membrane region domain-containing protein n=1 Tax=Aphanomyces astaci TaxID=112090 RepID=A0A397FDV3_APHAT|nr:hypothetical protein DYB30_001247 [Aphanomyces astaci]RHZ18362.1 hypothetical protein DYB31_006630 [Aphanomyces astaci]
MPTPMLTRLVLVLVVAGSVAMAHTAAFIFPDGCGRSQFANVPAIHRCSCANATRVSSVDALSFHYCNMHAHPQASVLLLCVMLCLMFYIVADTTSRFLVPAVTYIASASKMDPSVAGATLLAFANGMPDLISAIASFSGHSKHAGFGVGGLLGSGLVVSCFTLGYLAFLSNGAHINKRPFMRDVAFYLVALAGLVAVYRVGYVTVQVSLMALGLYALYTVSVVRMQHSTDETLSNEAEAADPVEKPSPAETKPTTPPVVGPAMLEQGGGVPRPDKSVKGVETPSQGVEYPPTYAEVALDSPSSTVSTAPSSDVDMSFDESGEGERDADDTVTSPTHRASVRGYLAVVTGWNDATLVSRCIAVVAFPVFWARHVTVPLLTHASMDHDPRACLSRVDVVCWAFCIPLFVLYVVYRVVAVSHELVMGVAATGLVLAFVAALLSAETRRSSSVHLAGMALALMTSSMWVFLVGHEIVAILHVLGVTLSISGGTLGILVLAWGNSMGDFFGNATLARQGHVQMASAACIAGPIFNTLVGGGLSLLLGCFRSKESTVALWSVSEKSTLRSGFCILLVCLVSLLVVGGQVQHTHRVSLTKWFGVFLMGLYSVFCVATLAEETTS